MAWVLVWRNANAKLEKAEHYFAPFPGQLSAEDFVKFAKGGTILLEGGLPPMYVENGPQ
jgi:mannan endo-1,4-beta-mannosidase